MPINLSPESVQAAPRGRGHHRADVEGKPDTLVWCCNYTHRHTHTHTHTHSPAGEQKSLITGRGKLETPGHERSGSRLAHSLELPARPWNDSSEPRRKSQWKKC